jgi:RpiR family transcriptional regulator, carbohydrate utilization regulator
VITSASPAADPLAVPDAIARIRTGLPGLSASERRVAEVVLADPEAVVHLSVARLAQLAGTSTASVVRACQALGFEGFQTLRLAVARGGVRLVQEIHEDVHPDDSGIELLSKVVAKGADAVRNSVTTIDAETLDLAIDAIGAARKVLVLGIGVASPLALETAYRLVYLGVDADAPTDRCDQLARATRLRPGDVALALSHHGTTPETVRGAEVAAQAGATVVALTSFHDSPLTRIADLALVAGSEESSLRIEAMASRLVHLSVLDAIFVALALRKDGAMDSLTLVNDVVESFG